MKKKITIIFCIMFIIFNFIFSSLCFVLADDDAESEQKPLKLEDFQIDTTDDVSEFWENQRNNNISIYSEDGEKISKGLSNNDKDAVTIMSSIVIRFFTFIVEWGNNIPQKAVEATDNTIDIDFFTIYSLVMGEYDFFNADFFSESGDYEDAGLNALISGEQDGKKKLSLGGQIKQNIKKFYNILRALSLAISLLVLVYIGIRMAISTLSTDKIKYRNMLFNWMASLVLLFVLHYIIIIFSYASKYALDVVKNLANITGVTNIEEIILKGMYKNAKIKIGFHLLSAFFVIGVFVYYELKFFIMYVKRFCEITFLIVIAPLITITYPIDKIKDNKAQAFSVWFKELAVKYSIQVVHALTYVIFIASAGFIAQEVPLVAGMFLLSLDKAEKIFRNVLNVKDNSFEKIKVPFIEGK